MTDSVSDLTARIVQVQQQLEASRANPYATGASLQLGSGSSTRENLKPSESPDCCHPLEELRRRTFSNGTVHYVRQCLSCGRASNAIARRQLSEEQMQQAPDYDEQLAERYQAACLEERRRKLERRRAELEPWRSAEYRDYLQSPRWAVLRRRVIERAGGVCEGCRSRAAVNVHHLTYSHIFHEFLWELVAVCRECHERYHQLSGWAT
jgi:hypothetical protein